MMIVIEKIKDFNICKFVYSHVYLHSTVNYFFYSKLIDIFLEGIEKNQKIIRKNKFENLKQHNLKTKCKIKQNTKYK